MDPAERTVPALVELQSRKAPGALALIDDEHTVTYGELEALSTSLSTHFGSLALGQDAVIGLCIERSAAQVIGALAIMKAGAAYLPLDPNTPAERLLFALRDAGASVVVTAADLPLATLAEFKTVHLRGDGSFVVEKPAFCDVPPVSNNGVGGFAREMHALRDAAPVRPDDLAYIIYTSGSTGRPKGVEITHAGLSNLSAWHRAAFEVGPADRASYVSAVGFDAAVWEVWPYLTAGASVYVASDAVAREPQALADWLAGQAITIAFVSTPIAERLLELDYPPETSLRIVLTGADVLHRYPPPSLPFELHNNYGPTEATVVATSGRVNRATGNEEDLPSIGRPIENTQIYIVDANGVPQGDGIEGEICIAGLGLARGYRGLPELTAEKFVWLALDGAPPVRIYRTGDRGRRHSDGSIAFLGRIDEQIKIRGFRIEPHEIEITANAHSDVAESAVVVRNLGAGDEQLVGYLVPRFGHTLSLEEIASFLATRLPGYMMPATFVELPALPLTANGKIDRAKLREGEIGRPLVAESYIAPRTVIEERLELIVAGLLRMNRVSVDGDFFKLGGHSLLGTQLIARLRDAFGVTLKLRFLFESPTIAALASEIERQLLEQRERNERAAPARDDVRLRALTSDRSS